MVGIGVWTGSNPFVRDMDLRNLEFTSIEYLLIILMGDTKLYDGGY